MKRDPKVNIAAVVPYSVFEALDRRAEREGKSLSGLIRQLLEEATVGTL